MAVNYKTIKINRVLRLDCVKDVIDHQLATDHSEISMNVVLEEQLASCVSLFLLRLLFAIKP